MLKIIKKANLLNIDLDSFYSIVKRYENHEGFCLMNTILNYEPCTIAFLSPFKKFTLNNLNEIKKFLDETQRYLDYDYIERVPFSAGYFSYDSFNEIENIKKVSTDNLNIPLAEFYFYSDIIIYRHKLKQIKHFEIQNQSEFWKYEESKFEMYPDPSIPEFNILELENYSNFNKETYLKKIKIIIDEIIKGNVYQVNLTQQFTLPYSGSAADFFLILHKLNSSNLETYYSSTNFRIVSNSPELFLSCDGKTLQTAPIKGTMIIDSEEKNQEILKNSKKNLAELSMIVDLERNDLGKIAKIGSVSVQNHAKVISTKNLYHLVSEIICNLKTKDIYTILSAVFPSGSITGAPKIAAMNLISELEDTKRGVYTGAIGYFSTNNSFNFNVAIRTVLIKDQKLIFSTGSGIVSDSNPEEEYNESLAKAISIFSAYKTAIAH